MPKALSLKPVRSARALHAAASRKERLRVRGTVVETGAGYSAQYRNVWLVLEVVGVRVRVTATPDSPLGTAAEGTVLDLAVTLTGMVDVSSGVYFAQRAQVLAMTPGQVA